MSVEYRIWVEGKVRSGYREALNGEALDTEHEPHLRSRVRWNGFCTGSEAMGSFGVVEAWTPERGWSEVRRDLGTDLLLSDKSVNREDDWRDDALQDLDRLLGAGRLFFAARKPSPFTPPEDLLRG